MNGEMQTTSTVRYQALNYLPKINRTKLYICFALTIHLLSAKCFSQIPVEVFAGHKRATFDIMFFKFFKDNTHFLKHKDIVNIYYDQNNVIGESIPRLSKYNFLLNKYVSFFINEEKVKILQEADAIYVEGLKNHGLYNQVWQAGAILLNVQSVGVMGDERTYENCIALRAVSSTDGMTADWVHLPWDFLSKVSNEIINNVRGINRVVYDISS